jgi:hypothetical protein
MLQIKSTNADSKDAVRSTFENVDERFINEYTQEKCRTIAKYAKSLLTRRETSRLTTEFIQVKNHMFALSKAVITLSKLSGI